MTSNIQASNEGKVAIVTGGTHGIGASIARRLASEGFTVIVNYACRVADAEAVVAGIRAAGGRAEAIQANVSAPAQVAAMFDQAAALFGGVDVLVNSAGVMQAGLVSLRGMDGTIFGKIVDTNLKGTFNTLRVAAKKLRQGGRIVNLSSGTAKLALPGYSVYAATKSAIETMTSIFAKELRGRNITGNAVAPGPTATDIFLTGKTQEQNRSTDQDAADGAVGQARRHRRNRFLPRRPHGVWMARRYVPMAASFEQKKDPS